MNYIQKYQRWLSSSLIDSQLKNELIDIEDNLIEIEERFYKDLTFGTGGLRGIIGAGTNRINIHTICKATQGLANFLKGNYKDRVQSVAIAYDSRNYSDIFALEAALVLAANNIKVYLFDSLRPTPELSYAVRYLGCLAGIVITASHNPSEYNGYKVYGSDGGQITLKTANAIIKEIEAIDIFNDVLKVNKKQAIKNHFLEYIGDDLDISYLTEVVNLSLRKDIANKIEDFKVVYTPLHGTGLMPIKRALSMLGYKNVYLVESQIEPDGNFPTVKSPNPEEQEAFTEGIKIAKKVNADILLGTDPDSDRVGVVAKNDLGEYKVLTGNQIGALLTHYIISSKEKVDANDAIIKTIVTSELGARIAESYGATVFDTLTGFKFIGEKIKEFEENRDYNFIFGYEESYGYLSGTFVRDKDAIIASVLITEMAAYYKSKDMSLFNALTKIYSEYGYYSDTLESYTFKGVAGNKQINNILDKFRDTEKLKNFFYNISIIEDYFIGNKIFVESSKIEEIKLPKANVIKIYFNNGCWFAVRPSGTEPKLKIYFSSTGKTSEESTENMNSIQLKVAEFIE